VGKALSNADIKKLAIALLNADSEDEVVELLKGAGLWDNKDLWRLYGDKEGNFAQAGNQQALPEAALVEKIVNSCDSRLMCECVLRGIDPESDSAPTSVRDAVAVFFEGKRTTGTDSGSLANWSQDQRTKQSRFITLAATGDRPTQGRRTHRMCLTIADQAEGQSPQKLPTTILSLNAKNKQRIRFVQGKFNMGGSGCLRFCGSMGLQLVISRRHPELAKRERKHDPSVDDWALTVVRREEPSNRSGDPVHSEFTYLAPLNAERAPREGGVLRFTADRLPLMPEHDEAYKRNVEWGSAIKLYEYETTVGQSNVLFPEGLLFSLERLLPEIALPIRIHECRGYKGDKERSFETPISGLSVRLEEGKGANLEDGFPLTLKLQVSGMRMTAKIYAFKEDKAQTYLKDEGVIFTVNGQAHGYLPKSIFSRPKAVGLPRLRDSLLVVVDCSTLTAIQREDLFMSSRDRLSKKPIRFSVEEEIEQVLKESPELRRLQQTRREKDVQSTLSEDRPLEEVLGRILSSSPTLRALFLQGRRLTRPFAGLAGGGQTNGVDRGDKEYKGKKHPTHFRIPGIKLGQTFRRHCELGRRTRVKFETDVENEYFSRAVDQGVFELEIMDSPRQMSDPTYSISLEDGSAYLNMALPTESEVGDRIIFQSRVMDSTLREPFTSVIELTVTEKHDHQESKNKKPKTKHSGGDGKDGSDQGIKLPTPIPVHENDEIWQRYKFNESTACHVISDPVEENGKTMLEHIFYINVDNNALKTEMKYSKQDPRLLEAKFKYANVLLGLAMLHEQEKDAEDDSNGDKEKETVQDAIRRVSSAVAPVLLPMIDQLAGLTEEQLEELSASGEDA
jgi:hypothetical protein